MTKPNTPHDSSEPVVERWMMEATREITRIATCRFLNNDEVSRVIARHYAARQPDSGEPPAGYVRNSGIITGISCHVNLYENGCTRASRDPSPADFVRRVVRDDSGGQPTSSPIGATGLASVETVGQSCPHTEPPASPAGDEQVLAEIVSRHSQDFHSASNPGIKLRMLFAHDAVEVGREYAAYITAQLRQDLQIVKSRIISILGQKLAEQMEKRKAAETALAQAGEQALRDAASDTIKLRKYGIGEPTRISVRTWLTERADALAAQQTTCREAPTSPTTTKEE